MVSALPHTNYVKLSLIPRPLDELASYIKATPFDRGWPVTIVDQVDL